jgi:hypothetical protein
LDEEGVVGTVRLEWMACRVLMQEHCKQANKTSAKAEDSWKCTKIHFENVLNLKKETLM